MALNPLKVFLFVIGGTVAAAATAFYSGQWQPFIGGTGREASSGKEAATPSGKPAAVDKPAKPQMDASLGTQTPAADSNSPAPEANGKAGTSPAQGSGAGTADRVSPAAVKPATGATPADTAREAAVPSAGDAKKPLAASDEKASAPPARRDAAAGEAATASADETTEPTRSRAKADSGNAAGDASPSRVAGAPANVSVEPAKQEAKAPSEAVAGSAAGKEAAPDAEQSQASLEPPVQPSASAPALENAGAQPSATGDPAAVQPDGPPPSGQAAKSQTLPSFDVLRVEPDGSTVVAGRGAPNARIEMMQSGQVLASAEANGDGEFAIVLDEPLKPGDHQIQLRGTKANGEVETSHQTAVVSVPTTREGQVLAMVEEPGAASRVLTMPESQAPAATADSDVPAGAGSVAPADSTSGGTPAEAPTEREAALAPGEETVSGAASGGSAPARPPTAASPASGARKGGALTQRSVSVQAVEIEGRRIFVAGIAAPNAAVRVYANDIRLGDARASAGGEFLVEAVRDLPVGSYTVRADVLNGRGAVTARAAVPFEREAGERLAAVAPELEAQANAQEAARSAAGRQAKAGGEAAASKPDSAAATAGRTPTAATEGGSPVGQPAREEVASAEPTEAKPAQPGLESRTSPPTAQAPSAQDMAAAGPSDTSAEPEAGMAASSHALDNASVPAASDGAAAGVAPSTGAARTAVGANGNATPSQQVGDTAVQAPSTGEAAAPAESSVAALETGKSEPALLPQPAAIPEIAPAGNASARGNADVPQGGSALETPEVAAAQPDIDGPVTTNAPKLQAVDAAVIIRRGDSLWRISRRVYGFGTRYSTIYLANTDQIRDPDLIMPGQVFAVPSRSQQGEDADMNAMGEQFTTRPSSTAGN